MGVIQRIRKMTNDRPKILLIDDEPAICEACQQIFTENNYLVEIAQNGTEGLKKFEEFNPDVVFIDLKMPGISGNEVLRKIIEKKTDAIPIVITGYASIESAVESMKNGAFDFLPKPFTSEELLMITKRGLERKRILAEKKRLESEKERMRQNFISLVSHELRTPLVAVIQYLEVLSGGMAGQISDQQKNILERMKIRLKELLDIINRWLKLARIEELNLKENFQEFEIKEVIEESVEMLKPLFQEKKINIVSNLSNEAIRIFGDRDLIKEVFVNIITNGIKYNREKGSLFINSRINGEFVVTEIIDTGIGISEDEIKRLGEEFYRVKREGIAGGSGLGLSIVKKILEIHNGKLEIKSKIDEGSNFSVYLPIAISQSRKEKKE